VEGPSLLLASEQLIAFKRKVVREKTGKTKRWSYYCLLEQPEIKKIKPL
jgi:hypothetical protein